MMGSFLVSRGMDTEAYIHWKHMYVSAKSDGFRVLPFLQILKQLQDFSISAESSCRAITQSHHVSPNNSIP